MPSLLRFSSAIAVVAMLSVEVNSQATYYIDPSSVPLETRQSWCQAQTTSCPLLCTQIQAGGSTTTKSNTCNATTLAYTCVCGNGLSPNATAYSQTIPFFECQEYGNQCVAACGTDNNCQSACRQDHPCGAQNPVRVNTTTSSTMAQTATGTAAGGAVYTGLAGSTTTNTKSGAQLAVQIGKSWGLAVVGAGIFGAFALVL